MITQNPHLLTKNKSWHIQSTRVDCLSCLTLALWLPRVTCCKSLFISAEETGWHVAHQRQKKEENLDLYIMESSICAKTYRSERSKVKSISIATKGNRIKSSILMELYHRLPSQTVFEDDIFLIQIIFLNYFLLQIILKHTEVVLLGWGTLHAFTRSVIPLKLEYLTNIDLTGNFIFQKIEEKYRRITL